MRFVLLFIALTSIPLTAHADWEEAENVGSVINTAFGEWYPVIARDGSFMIFVSDRPGGHGQSDLWISYSYAGEWTAPINMGANVNSSSFESAPFLAENDTMLYFASFMGGGQGGMDIWCCPLTNGIPGTRANVGAPVNGPFLDCCPVVSPDGNQLYICSDRPGSQGSMDVWVSERVGGSWTTPVNAGINLNSPQTDCPRWISDDGLTLIVSATRLGGYGSADMWYAERVGGVWGPLVNMGPEINTAAEEWGPGFIDHAGAIGGTIYFGSSRGGGHGGRDVWRADSSTTPVSPVEPHRRLVLRVFPNPNPAQATVSYALAEAAHVSIRLYDVEGRLVRTLRERGHAAGDYQVTWDGTTEGGAMAPGGVYICRLRVGAEQTTQKLVLTRQ